MKITLIVYLNNGRPFVKNFFFAITFICEDKMEIDLKNLSLEQRKKIGDRIRGARIMAGLTQEQFSTKYSISLSTLKNFEIARVIPRTITVLSIIKSIQAEGIAVDESWIFYGIGNRVKKSLLPNVSQISKDVFDEINLLKKHLENNGHNPISMIIKDNDMFPKYLQGDILVGVLCSHKKLLSLLSNTKSLKQYFLVEQQNEFMICSIVKYGSCLFYMKNMKNDLLKITNEKIANIIWHRHLH